MPSPQPTLSQAERFDACCDRFEAAWRAGDSVRAEDWVAKEPAADRAALLELLLPLEMELWQATGATLAAGDYQRRFPDNLALVQRALDRFASRRASIDTSVSRGGSVRTTDYRPGSPADAPAPEGAVPGRIGRFAVKDVLGAGAFGKVYRGVDPDLGREVAIKVPLAESVRTPNEKERFLREARAAATLQHPNVCAIHEVGEQDGMPFIVMALVPGQSLADMLKSRTEPMAPKQIAMIVKKLALALDVAHKKGIVHRDLKPANIMFDRDRKDVVIMDFGLARAPTSGSATATQTGVIMGTPAYMSPEQARGEAKTLGPAADIYSLGVILYELLTLKRPFSGTITEVLGKILHVKPKAPSAIRPGVDPKLEAACLKAMAKGAPDRFDSMKEFATAMDGVLRGEAPAEVQAGPAQVPTAKAVAESGGSTMRRFEDLFEKKSKAHRAQTTKAVERALAMHRTPRWVFVALGLILLAGFTTLGIIFFTRSDKVKVTIELTDVDLADPSLSFFLNDEPIPAEVLANPVELSPGEHVVTVKRGKVIVKRVLLTVRGGRDPGIKVKDIPPPNPTEPESAPDDRALVQGTWYAVAEEYRGVEVPRADVEKMNKILIVKGDSWVIERVRNNGEKGVMSGTGKLVSSNQPKWFDWTGTDFDGKQAAMIGLYELEGDTLRIVSTVRPAGGAATRPTVFRSAGPGSGSEVHTFKRRPLPQPDTGFVPLFNGKDLTGWKAGEAAAWRVEGDELVGENSRDFAHSWLFTDQEYGDCVLRFEYQLSERANGGVALRAMPDQSLAPPQVEVDLFEYPGYPIGSLVWGTRPPRGVEKLAAGQSPAVKGWQRMEVTLRGSNLTVRNNDGAILTQDLAALAARPNALPGLSRATGRIGLQAPGTGAGMIRFRRIEIKAVPPASSVDDGFVSIFNGQDFSGWTLDGSAGRWKVDGGDLIATGLEGKIDHLFTDKSYADFHLRLQFQVGDKAHSGLLFRVDQGDAKHLNIGLNDERAFPWFPPGVLFVAGGEPGKILPNKLRPLAEWNELDLVLQGSSLRASINGQLVIATDLKMYVPLPNSRPSLTRTSGKLGLWSSGGHIRYRNIRIKELAPAETGFVRRSWYMLEDAPGVAIPSPVGD